MSLVVALGCADGVAMCADSRYTSSPDGMNYAITGQTKLLERPDALLGLVGAVGNLRTILRGIGAFGSPCEFTKKLQDSSRRLWGEDWFSPEKLERHLGGRTAILVATHRNQDPQIFQFWAHQDWGVNALHEIGAIGQNLHGGCYYLSRFLLSVSTLKQAAYLSYFSVREVISLDGAAGEPVEVRTVQEGKIRAAPEEWMEEFRIRHAAMIEHLGNEFSN